MKYKLLLLLLLIMGPDAPESTNIFPNTERASPLLFIQLRVTSMINLFPWMGRLFRCLFTRTGPSAGENPSVGVFLLINDILALNTGQPFRLIGSVTTSWDTISNLINVVCLTETVWQWLIKNSQCSWLLRACTFRVFNPSSGSLGTILLYKNKFFIPETKEHQLLT